MGHSREKVNLLIAAESTAKKSFTNLAQTRAELNVLNQ